MKPVYCSVAQTFDTLVFIVVALISGCSSSPARHMSV